MTDELKKKQEELKDLILRIDKADVQAGHLSYLLNGLSKKCVNYSLTGYDPDHFYDSDDFNYWCTVIEVAIDDLLYELRYFARYAKCNG